jgi:hypothetical protein
LEELLRRPQDVAVTPVTRDNLFLFTPRDYAVQASLATRAVKMLVFLEINGKAALLQVFAFSLAIQVRWSLDWCWPFLYIEADNQCLEAL